MRSSLPRIDVVAIAATLALSAASLSAHEPRRHAYQLERLVSDETGKAAHQDANLINGWGVAFNPNGFVWVANNHTGTSTLYDGAGNRQTLVVTVPGRPGDSALGSPTGIVFNGSSNFVVAKGTTSGPSRFLFATEEGVIAGWAPNVDATNALGVVATPDAVYKGLALGANGTDVFLYATDFGGGKVDVFDKTFAPVSAPGRFTDRGLPAGYAPFGIQNINGDIYVTFASKQPGETDETAGPGLGVVDVFDADGNLLRRVASHGKLNAPWGLALAPAGFGKFANDLLVGNFGDGAILAFDARSGEFRGRLRGADGHLLKVDGLWGMAFGNGILQQPTNALFVAAGPADETHGLYAKITGVTGGRADDHPQSQSDQSDSDE
jgi:uncharacterized protein (TIGR03118 family)